MNLLRCAFLLLVGTVLNACSSLSNISLPDISLPDVTSNFHPYRIDVRQGNYVSQEMVAQLKPGMTRDQVRFVLGTPLITDMFHADRWDYVYRFQPGYGELQQRRFTVYFVDDKLARVAGDVVAAGAGDTQAVFDAPSRNRVIDITADGDSKAGQTEKADSVKKAGDAKDEAAKAAPATDKK